MYYACRNRQGRERDNKRDASPMTIDDCWPDVWDKALLVTATLGPRVCYYHPPTRSYRLSSRLSTLFVLGIWKKTDSDSRVGTTRMGTIACQAWGFWFKTCFVPHSGERGLQSDARVQAERDGKTVLVYGRWQVGPGGSFKQEQTMTHKRKKNTTAWWCCAGIQDSQSIMLWAQELRAPWTWPLEL